MDKQEYDAGHTVYYSGPFSRHKPIIAVVRGYVPGFRGIAGVYVLRLASGGEARATADQINTDTVGFVTARLGAAPKVCEEFVGGRHAS